MEHSEFSSCCVQRRPSKIIESKRFSSLFERIRYDEKETGPNSLLPSLMNLQIQRWLLASLLPFGMGVEMSLAEEKPTLAIKFTSRAITFSGQVDSEETGQELAKAARKVRPDLPIQNRGLRVNPSANIPPIADLRSLLAEIGLSSHEGGISFFPDRVVLTGMTDSVVTVTAIQLRLEPILEGRNLVNRICIVSSADLPNLDIRLSSGQTSEGLLDFDFYPSAEGAFVAPGLPLEKIYPTLVLMSSFEKFVDPAKLRQSATVRATPLTMSETALSPPTGEEVGPPQLRAIPAGPITTYVELEPLLFSRDSFLLQAQSRETLARNEEILANPTYAGKKLIVESRKWQGSSAAYIEYLAEKRANEAKKLLNGIGIPDSRIETKLSSSSSPVDRGEVRLLIEIPPPIEKSEEAGDDADALPNDDSPTAESPEGSESTRESPEEEP